MTTLPSTDSREDSQRPTTASSVANPRRVRWTAVQQDGADRG